MKRQPTEWEKIFANDVTNKGLTSRVLYAFELKLVSIQNRYYKSVNVITSAITKKISIEYTQKEMQRESKYVTTKKSTKYKRSRNEENEKQKAIRHKENK